MLVDRQSHELGDLVVPSKGGCDRAAPNAGVVGQLVHLEVDAGPLGTLPDLLITAARFTSLPKENRTNGLSELRPCRSGDMSESANLVSG